MNVPPGIVVTPPAIVVTVVAIVLMVVACAVYVVPVVHAPPVVTDNAVTPPVPLTVATVTVPPPAAPSWELTTASSSPTAYPVPGAAIVTAPAPAGMTVPAPVGNVTVHPCPFIPVTWRMALLPKSVT